MAWAMKDEPPAQSGRGRAAAKLRTTKATFSITCSSFTNFRMTSGRFLGQRQIGEYYNDNSDYLMGATGIGKIQSWQRADHQGQGELALSDPARKPTCIRYEHNELFASIRNGKPINDGDGWRKAP